MKLLKIGCKMGCSCNKKPGSTGPNNRKATIRATSTPSDLRALELNAAAQIQERSPSGISKERKLLEKKRRDAIINRLGR